MKKIKLQRNPLSEINPESNLKILTKGTLLSYFITMAIFLIYAVTITYSSIGESYLQVVVMITTILSLIISSFYVSKKIKSKGLLYGILVGVLYSVIMIFLSLCISPQISINSKSFIILALAVSSGGVGGILGVNTISK